MIDLITGHQGVAHISADQIASINNAMMDNYGANKVMRLVGGELTANGLTIEVGTGYWRANGFDMEVQEAETIYIDPTAAGLSRIDNIYVEILQDIPTGAQRSEIVTVNGEPSATPTAPEAPTAPELNTDILLQVVPLASVTVTEGAMVMTDLSVAYEMVTPSELEAVETIATGAQEAAGNAQTTANTASTNANNALGMIRSTSSDAYSSSKAYSVGDHVIYNNKVYKCITACSAGSWSTNQSCFSQTTLTSAVTDLNSSLSELKDDTGWQTLTFGQYRRIGKTVQVNANTGAAALQPNTSVLVGTLPTGCRPNDRICNKITAGSDASVLATLVVQTDGKVYISQNTSSAVNYVTGTILFFTN